MCECIEQVEKNILQKLKDNHPERSYNDALNAFEGTGIQNKASGLTNFGKVFIYHEFKVDYTFTKTNGEQSKMKRQTTSLFPVYCCFCGRKLEKSE